MRSLITVLFSIFILTGCSTTEQAHTNQNQTNWVVTPTFQAGDLTLYGKYGRFGIIKLAGPGDGFGTAGHYQVFFGGKREEFASKKYKLLAIHKETGEKQQLYEWAIDPYLNEDVNKAGAIAQSGGKYGFSKSGLWRLEMYVGDNFFDSIVVEVK